MFIFFVQIKFIEIGAGTAPSNGAIWEKLSEQNHHKRTPYFMPDLVFLVQIRHKFYAHFGRLFIQ